jgi:hypothetical protein
MGHPKKLWIDITNNAIPEHTEIQLFHAHLPLFSALQRGIA